MGGGRDRQSSLSPHRISQSHLGSGPGPSLGSPESERDPKPTLTIKISNSNGDRMPTLDRNLAYLMGKSISRFERLT